MVNWQIKIIRRNAGCLLLMLVLGAPSALPQDQTAATAADGKDQAAGLPQLSPPPKPDSASRQFLKNIWADQKTIFTTPVRMSAHQYFTIALPLTAATGGLIATDVKAIELLPGTPDQIRWCKLVSNVGAVYTLGGLSVGAMAAGKLGKAPHLSRMGQRSAEALVDAVSLSYVIKATTLRERPDQNDGKGRFWKGGTSFPSAHAIDTWAVATTVARSPNCPKWLAISSYSVAGIVSLSRWGANKHFPSDILVGSVFGWFIGAHVAKR